MAGEPPPPIEEMNEMADPRIERLAQVLVRYSLRVKKGDWVHIMGAYLAHDLMLALTAEILKAGGNPTLDVEIPGAKQLLLSRGNMEQISFTNPRDAVFFRKADKSISILGSWNSRELAGVSAKKISTHRKARGKLLRTMLRRMGDGSHSWVGTLRPTPSGAQDADMSMADYEDFVYTAGKLHKRDPVAEWKKLSQVQAKIVKKLSRIGELHIVGKETDLKVKVGGRKWVNCDGRVNFPDGEIFTGPIEDSAEGTIRYTFPAVYDGREVEDVRLTFRKGRVVEARAGKGRDLLEKTLDIDPGARRLGELAFGTNYEIQRFSKNTLFDEKIGGTMHLALGNSIPESLGVNKSAVHWDMVCDTRKGFVVYGDGKPIHKNGKFLF